jgi:hypothetical protein
MHPGAASRSPLHTRGATAELCSIGGGKAAHAPRVEPRVVRWHRPEAQHTTCPFPHPHHIQAGLFTHQYSQALYIPSQPSSPCTEIVRGSPHTHDGDAGRWTRRHRFTSSLYVAPWSTGRTYRGQAAPSSSGHTISPHAGRRFSLCVSAPDCLWLTTKGHAKLLHCCCTPSIQTPLAFAHTCMAIDGLHIHSSHPRRLHAHAVHRAPTARADRPSRRPYTGMRPSCIHSCALFLGCSFPSRRHCYIDLW